MKKLILSIVIIFASFQLSNSQNTNNKILNVEYKLLPISQYYFNHNEATPPEEKEFDIALRSGYHFKFNLSVNLKTNQSLFQLDTLIVTKVKGKEDYWTDPEDKPKYCIKEANGSYLRTEELFNQETYINGKSNIQWEIKNETKKILNFECTKAISKNKNYLITVWFTKDIPVSAGPSNFFGLPGLVLWAEDYFSTISVEKISYSENDGTFEKLYSKQLNIYQSKKQDNEIEEKIFLLKKSELSEQFMQGR
ncbi:GLPGLI family protein [Flavobacterium sp.]|uniref:GLPGLI family protein n=1 Tax=Flavobacterium sp. TaxID=239 RepID=UPI0037532D6B